MPGGVYTFILSVLDCLRNMTLCGGVTGKGGKFFIVFEVGGGFGLGPSTLLTRDVVRLSLDCRGSAFRWTRRKSVRQEASPDGIGPEMLTATPSTDRLVEREA